jgi:hypothetical protein
MSMLVNDCSTMYGFLTGFGSADISKLKNYEGKTPEQDEEEYYHTKCLKDIIEYRDEYEEDDDEEDGFS